MEIKNPKPKRQFKLRKTTNFEIVKLSRASQKIKAVFNGFLVRVEDTDAIQKLTNMGYFGKANFSRSASEINKDDLNILRARQYKERSKYRKNNGFQKVLVVPDSDNDYEHYFENLLPINEIDKSGVKEVICLSLEEAFFLVNCVKSLNVFVNGNITNDKELWDEFAKFDPYFKYNYVVYNYFRCKNWIVKPGMKFGGDFVLYKQGPPIFHASYVVIIDIFNETYKRIEELTRRAMDNISVLCLNRLCETAGKELMVCRVILPKDNDLHFQNLSNITIMEIILNRWNEEHI